VPEKKLTPQVLIIGAGVTGTGIARDLAFRGISSLVIEKGNINDGASGRNHGLLDRDTASLMFSFSTTREEMPRNARSLAIPVHLFSGR